MLPVKLTFAHTPLKLDTEERYNNVSKIKVLIVSKVPDRLTSKYEVPETICGKVVRTVKDIYLVNFDIISLTFKFSLWSSGNPSCFSLLTPKAIGYILVYF